MTTPFADRSRRRLAAAALSAAVALFAGCGSDDTPTASEPETATATATAGPHIETPANGDVIAATAELGDTRGTRVPVTGTAEPNAKVEIASGCQLANCTSTVTADEAGEFKGEVSASTNEDPYRVTITIADEHLNSDRVIIVIGNQDESSESEPRATRTPRPKRRNKRPRSSATSPPSATVAPPASTPAPQGTAVPPSNSGAGGSGPVVVIGDSLAQGMQPYLAGALNGRKVSVSARIGRPLAEGMGIFKGEQIQPGAVYAFSLFTNDDPSAVSALESAVRDSVNRAGCAVWATIVRPPYNGVSYDAANRKLAQLKSSLGDRLQLVDWAAAVRSHSSWISGSDGVHATPEGYRNRATLYAQAINACG